MLPVLWLCGPPGVGKSTVAWELFGGLPGAGYVDIDQLGMCFPEIPSDPGRTLLEAHILGRAVANFRAAGASCLIVSGYIDAKRGVHTSLLPDAHLTVLRLRCDVDELERRLDARPGEDLPRDEVLKHAEEMDRLAYEVVDTSGRTVPEVLAAVRDRLPAVSAREPAPWPDIPPAPPGEIVLVCGATATGKSTVGFTLFSQAMSGGRAAGFVDLQQIGFLRPGHGGNQRLKAANLAAAWRHFHEHGARRLVAAGHVVDLHWFTEALSPARVTVVRLHAGPDDLRERIRRRGLGGPPNLAGDELRHQPQAVLDKAWDAAVAQTADLDRVAIGDVRVDTSGRPAEQLASEIAGLVGWS